MDHQSGSEDDAADDYSDVSIQPVIAFVDLVRGHPATLR